MKKTRRTAVIVILAVVALLMSVLAFTLLISAENAAEATLTVETITKNSSGYEDEGKTKKVSTETGSYQTLLTKLASLDPEVDTRYTLKLSADAVQTAPVNLNIGAMAEVCIDLGGNKLSSALADAAITVSGSGKFRVNGNYTSLGECGQLVLSGAGEFVSIAAGSTVFADIKNLDATYLGDYYLTAFGGEITLRESYVTYAGSESGAVVYAEGATANIKYVDVTAIDATSVLYLSGAKGYIEGGYAYAGTLVESDDKASYALLASVDAETVIAFKIGSLDTKTYVLGGKIDISAALVAGQATANTLVFYYGDGTMKLSGAGADPTGYGVQTHCSFAEVDDDVYVMSTSSTATAMSTTATLGETPVVKTHSSFVKGLGTDGISRAVKKTVTATTIAINTVLKDGEQASWAILSGNEHVSVIIDFNGHTVTWSDTSSKNFNYAGDFHYTVDGADVNGKRGGMVSNSAHMMFVYPRQASSTGVNNRETVTRIENMDFTVTNMGSAGSDAFINVNSGDFFMNGCTLTYTGTALDDSTTGKSFYMFVFDHDYGPGVNAHVENVIIKNEYVGERVMNVTAVNTRDKTRAWFTNLTVDGTYLAISGSAGTSTLVDSKLTVTGQVFSEGTIHLYDTAITVPTGKLSSTSTGVVYIHPTDKCATTISTGSNTLLGKYEVTKEGFAMYPTADNVYELTDGIDSPEPITLPKIFANGMVFQRGKTINVFGYCPDTDAELKVTLGDRVGTCKVDENGEFYCELAPLPASWGLTLTIEQTNHMLENKVIFTDVAVGEVWVMSGQSNAQLQSGYLEDVAELAVLADTVKNVRTYKSTASFTLNPSKYGSGSWDTTVNSSNMKSTSSSAVSAVGLAAVFRLAAELGPDVPVALVHAARGGSPIAGWLDYETLKELSPSKAAEYEKFCKDNANVSPLPDSGRTTIGCCLYNHQIAPYEGFEVAGVMWYQGCSDLSSAKRGTEGRTYTEYFEALERVYRRVFGNDSELPFYVMELAPYTTDSDDSLSRFKAEQYDFCAALDNTYLVSIANEGAIWAPTQFSQGFIHPTRKSPIANRTAYAILANEYGVKLGDVYAHPEVKSITAAGNTVTVTFDSDIKLFFGDKPVGFEVSADGTTWAAAEGRIEGKSVILTSSVASAKYVRYGYSTIHAELADGKLIEIETGKMNSTEKTITIENGGVTYVIDDAGDLVRTLNYGNITNASGVPMPTFKLPVSN